MARRKKPGDEEILRWADELQKLGRDPAVFLQRAVLGEETFLDGAAMRSADDGEPPWEVRKRVPLGKLQKRVEPQDLEGIHALYSPTVLHQLFRIRLALAAVGNRPDLGPDDYTARLHAGTTRTPKLAPPSDAEAARSQAAMTWIARALDGELGRATLDRYRQVSEAAALHDEIRQQLAAGAPSVEVARARVAEKHRTTPDAIRRRIDRAKKAAPGLNLRGFFPALKATPRRRS